MVKLLEFSLCLAYVLYDLAPLARVFPGSAAEDALGTGTIGLVACTCTAEVVLMLAEIYTIWRMWRGGNVWENSVATTRQRAVELQAEKGPAHGS